MINVTKTYLPPIEEYISYVREIWDNGWITNNGPMVIELEKKLKEYLGAKHLVFCSNGTIALQIAIKALGLKKEIITTPFSYVATVNSILWESCTPVFVDIDPATFCIDATKIEAAITKDTEAILAVHVYGIPCDISTIEDIARRHSLKVIYDGAHGFGVKQNGISILNSGDVTTCSFHATKLFHTIEGGALITSDDELAKKLMHMRQFGHVYDEYFSVGINGKNSEMHAAMGLTVLPHLEEIIEERKKKFEYYSQKLEILNFKKILLKENTEWNYSYFPILFETEEQLLKTNSCFNQNQIFPRRYFFPSLNILKHLKGNKMPVSECISSRILCLPFYDSLNEGDIDIICDILCQPYYV